MSEEFKKSEDIPATKKMIDETRAELKNNIASVRLEVKAVHTKLDTKIDKVAGELRGEMQSLKTELRGEMQELRGEMKSMSEGIRSEIKDLTAEVRRSLARSEEQHAQNLYVLDGYNSLQNQIKLNEEKNEQEHKEFRAAIRASKEVDH